jgi:hypothetical protein
MIAPLGSVNCSRMSSANEPAISMMSKPVKKYWNPITLWSSEKTYFANEPFGGGWM